MPNLRNKYPEIEDLEKKYKETHSEELMIQLGEKLAISLRRLSQPMVSPSAGRAPASMKMALNDDVDYDLAIICYGQNDSTDGFSTNYESIIRAIKSKYPDCSIISILESSQRTYTEKMTTIQSICEHYSIPVADTIAAFNDSGKAYDDLTGDGVHPNDAGQEIYFETVKTVIDDNVAASTGKMSGTDVINTDVHKFDNFDWYDARCRTLCRRSGATSRSSAARRS